MNKEPFNDTDTPQDTQQKNTQQKVLQNRLPWVGSALVALCIAGGFFGSWLLLASGFVTPNLADSITKNRDTIVLQEGEIVSDVFNKVSPSAVSITTQMVSQNTVFGTQVSEGAGSGIIVSKDGYVLTNKHVVPENAGKVTVVTSDGKEYADVTVVGRDPFNDLAFLKINGVSDLTPAALGDSSQVKPGQKVVAIGNALGIFRNSVTSGIVSGLGRPVQAQDGLGTSEKLENLFQTDAAINPGNSGGPLVNLQGEVIGINTAVSTDGQAIGFAIPIDDAKNIIDSVLTTGKVVKPYLGVRYVSLDPTTAEQYGTPVKEGALVLGDANNPAVLPGSPADKAGLQNQDIITKVNDQNIDATHGMASLLSRYKPGDKVELTLLRGGQEQKISVTLEEYKL